MAIAINIEDLERAFRIWDERAKEEGWEDRDDPEKHLNNAKFLFATLVAGMLPTGSSIELK